MRLAPKGLAAQARQVALAPLNDPLVLRSVRRGACPCTRDKWSLNAYRPSVIQGAYSERATGDVGETTSASGKHGAISCSVEHVTRPWGYLRVAE